MRLIDADALMEKMKRRKEYVGRPSDPVCLVEDAPTIDALALLKEQEAVKPEKEYSGSGITWWNVCGNCKTAINPNDKYCHECGTFVLWEGR